VANAVVPEVSTRIGREPLIDGVVANRLVLRVAPSRKYRRSTIGHFRPGANLQQRGVQIWRPLRPTGMPRKKTAAHKCVAPGQDGDFNAARLVFGDALRQSRS